MKNIPFGFALWFRENDNKERLFKMNILTIDVEEFTLSGVNYDVHYESRLEQEVGLLLDILDDMNIKATFFYPGEIVDKHTDILQEIARRFDIGLHGYRHLEATKMSTEEFRQDVLRAKDTVEALTGKSVSKFRAPRFALNKDYVKVLFDCGIETDCSCVNINHQFGKKIIERAKPCLLEYKGRTIKEFPPTSISFLGKGFGFLGGGYFRLLPYGLIRHFSERNKDYLLTYVHPRDFDAAQPVVGNISPARKFKSYVGLQGAEKKLRHWLTEYTFTDITTAEKLIDWQSVPVVEL